MGVESDGSLLARLRLGLAGRYRIERELGGGGMSRVFLAEEVALARPVVLKVLPPELARVLSGERFTQEARVAARLQHPHIVPLLATGETDGLLYYTMPFVEGESLRARLAREGALPIPEAVRLLRDVADALGSAHAHGVVHRDIKPDNILLSQGHAAVTDFGIAKAASSAGSEASLTATGMVLGTPSYMAPEQASADPHVDHRADLYALGVVAYEMLAGEPPFSGPTAQSLIAAHVTRHATPLGELRASVPAALAALVMRLLEKRPADRVQSASEVVAALDAQLTPTGLTAAPQPRPWPVGLVMGLYVISAAAVLGIAWLLRSLFALPSWFLPAAGVLLLLGVPIMLVTAVVHNQRTGGARPASTLHRVFTWRRALGGGLAALGGLGLLTVAYLGLRAASVGPFGTLIAKGRLAERERVLVADFTNHTADSSLGDAITQAIRVDLAQSKSISLLPPDFVQRVLRLMGTPADSRLDPTLAREVAARGGIKAVVIGDVQQAGAGIMVSAQLVGVDSGEVLVAHREVAKDSTEILTAVSGVSRRLRERIGESLRALEASAPLAEVTTPSLEALRKYSQGIRADDEGREDQGVRVLEEAVAIDTGFAMAWRKLGTMLSNQRVAQDRVIDAITRAHGLRARLTERERRLTEATYYSIVRGREDSAIISLERLLDQWPNDGWALNNIGVYLSRNGDSRGAVSYYRRSIVADPFNGSAYTNMMGAALQAGMADTAAAVAAEFERMLPGNADVPFIRASLALGRQEVDSGARLLEAGWAKSGADPRARRRWAYRLAGARQLQGRLAEGEELLQEVEGMARAAGDLDGQVDALAKRVYLIGRYSTQPERAAQVLADGEQRLGLSDQSPSVPYFVLAAAAARAGVIAKANRYLAASRAQLAATPTNVMRMEIDWAAGEAAAASGQDIEAVIDSIRALMPAPCLACPHASLGMLFDRLDQKDSALVHYRVFADAYEAGWQFGLYRIDRPYVYHRLGELYEWKGDRTRALEYYEKFVDLWKGADPELQPRVAAARKRIAQLIKEPQG